MTIERNGQTIELTDAEIEQAYRIRRKYYAKADLYHKINSMIGAPDDWEDEISCDDEDEFEIGDAELTGKRLKEIVTDEWISDLADDFENALDQNDGYWESYWITAEECIEEAIEDEMKEEK